LGHTSSHMGPEQISNQSGSTIMTTYIHPASWGDEVVCGSPSVEQGIVTQTLDDVSSKDVWQLCCRVLGRGRWDRAEHKAQHCK
jgi:hypothetical protein